MCLRMSLMNCWLGWTMMIPIDVEYERFLEVHDYCHCDDEVED